MPSLRRLWRRNRRIVLAVTSLLLATVLLFHLYGEKHKTDVENLINNIKTWKSSNIKTYTTKAAVITKGRRKKLLVYTDLFKKTPWHSLSYNYQFKGCPVQNCRVTYNKSDLETSDAVLFHAYDVIGNLSQLNKMTKNRASQRWIIFNMEPPPFFKFNNRLASMEGVFNWTMNYKSNSDIIRPYNSYLPYNEIKLSKVARVATNHAKSKENMVAWLVTNCRFSTRNHIVQKLIEYKVPVHVYGPCSKKFGQNRSCEKKRDGKCLEAMKKYKFYLSFENSFCVDYISEKYWKNGLLMGTVPVVLGGADYKRLAIPGSYIDVLEFPSLKDLANHLIMLDKNDTAYNQYFDWMKHYYITMERYGQWQCQLCAKLNDVSLPAKSYANRAFEQFFSMKSNCGIHEDKVKQLIT